MLSGISPGGLLSTGTGACEDPTALDALVFEAAVLLGAEAVAGLEDEALQPVAMRATARANALSGAMRFMAAMMRDNAGRTLKTPSAAARRPGRSISSALASERLGVAQQGCSSSSPPPPGRWSRCARGWPAAPSRWSPWT